MRRVEHSCTAKHIFVSEKVGGSSEMFVFRVTPEYSKGRNVFTFKVNGSQEHANLESVRRNEGRRRVEWRPVPMLALSSSRRPVPMLALSSSRRPVPVLALSSSRRPVPMLALSSSRRPVPVLALSSSRRPVPMLALSSSRRPVPMLALSSSTLEDFTLTVGWLALPGSHDVPVHSEERSRVQATRSDSPSTKERPTNSTCRSLRIGSYSHSPFSPDLHHRLQ